MSFKVFFLFFFVFFVCFFVVSIFSSGGHSVQPSQTVLAISVKRHKMNTSVKLLYNRATGHGGDVF